MKKTILLLITLFFITGCARTNISTLEDEKREEETPVEKETLKNVTTSFIAGGDNLIHGSIYVDPHYVNNDYDFTPIYKNIKPYIQSKDIAFINQETMLGGHDLGLSSYPMFNSPQEIGDAVFDTGFNWINHATNHTLDVGEAGVIKTLEYWDNKDVKVTGIARNESERNQAVIIEKNGVKFGLLAYTYGTNGIPIPEGKDYLVNLIDKETIENDVKALRSSVDSILVSMHWGVEYTHHYSEEQEDLAYFLSNLGVDVIIGTHPHVIQPIEWIQSENGKDTLVIYSLGNLLSAQNVNDRMLGGLANFDIEYNPNTKETSVKNVSFMPTVNHYNKAFQDYSIIPLKDYDETFEQSHYLYGSYNMSKEYFNTLVDQVMGENIELIK